MKNKVKTHQNRLKTLSSKPPPSRNSPKMAWDEPQAANATLNQDPQEAEGEGRGPRVRQWLNRAKGTLSGVAALFRCAVKTYQ